MTKKRGQSPSVEIDERQAVVNRATQAANWCVQILREFLVLADAATGTDESPTCRTAIFENVKGYGFQQQIADPLKDAAAYISTESIRGVLPHFDGESDRPLIASVDAWSNSWHEVAFQVLSELAENANLILRREVVIDYRDASEDELRYFKLTMSCRRVPEDWFDVLFFVKHQWRFRTIKLDQLGNGILRENLRTRGANEGNSPHSTKVAVNTATHSPDFVDTFNELRNLLISIFRLISETCAETSDGLPLEMENDWLQASDNQSARQQLIDERKQTKAELVPVLTSDRDKFAEMQRAIQCWLPIRDEAVVFGGENFGRFIDAFICATDLHILFLDPSGTLSNQQRALLEFAWTNLKELHRKVSDELDMAERTMRREISVATAETGTDGQESPLLTEPMTIQQLKVYFDVNRNKMSEILRKMSGAEKIDGLWRVPLDKMPPKYHVKTGLIHPTPS